MSSLLEYKCPCCGGSISFDSSAQKMKCPYCDTEFDLDTLKSYEEMTNGAQPSEMNWAEDQGSEWSSAEGESLKVYVCDSCGGEIVCDDDTAASKCPFCDSPVIMQGNLTGTLRPDVVIPFKLDKAAAKNAFREYLKDKKLLPSMFRNENRLDDIQAVYVPVWLFDADADADMLFDATQDRSWSDGSYRYTETSHYNVARSGHFAFRNVPVGGSTKIDDKLLESLEPFDQSEAVDFHKGYLSGYIADKYDTPAEECIERANERITDTIETQLRRSVEGEYNVQNVTNRSIRFNDGKRRYALYPVWTMNARWEGETYLFAMNGQTGKFVGDLPMDKKKYWASFAGIAAACAAVIYLLVHLFASC